MLRKICIKINKRSHLLCEISAVTIRPFHSTQTAKKLIEDDGKNSTTLSRFHQEMDESKKALKWRIPIGDRPEDWNSKLKLLADEEQTSDFIIMMQQPFNFNSQGLINWLTERRNRIERHMQMYVPERHGILGPDLASAHFLLYRGGAVKFLHDPMWIRANEDKDFDLPKQYDVKFKIEGIRCDKMVLHYEGLENLRCLEHLKKLSFRNVTTFDDWCLDRVSGSQYPKLEVLDISGTKTTVNGLSCLYRIPTLELLIVDNPQESLEYELAVAMLEEALPRLKTIAATKSDDFLSQ